VWLDHQVWRPTISQDGENAVDRLSGDDLVWKKI
jgi:hypothetical protein